jgi:hypothetical protein
MMMVWDVMLCSSVSTVCADDLEESAYETTWHQNLEDYDPQEVIFSQN